MLILYLLYYIYTPYGIGYILCSTVYSRLYPRVSFVVYAMFFFVQYLHGGQCRCYFPHLYLSLHLSLYSDSCLCLFSRHLLCMSASSVSAFSCVSACESVCVPALHLHPCFIYVCMLVYVCDNGLVAACLGKSAEPAPQAWLCCVTGELGTVGNFSNCGTALRQTRLAKSHSSHVVSSFHTFCRKSFRRHDNLNLQQRAVTMTTQYWLVVTERK